ncbi:glycosyltransferase [Microbacterium schleiferi]|uniref:glycosyltransferase n=1 Tax=Microbacterium schleiferi TaxID=69362 RepID=UPI00311FF891
MAGPISAAKDLARELRRVPALRGAFERTDPIRRAKRIVQSGLIDVDLYGMLTSQPGITAEEAAEHYVRWGHWAGLPINALLDDATLRRSVGGGERPPVFEYLWTRSFSAPVSPFWDAAQYAREEPNALRHPAGPVGHMCNKAQHDPQTPITVTRGGQLVTMPWSEWRAEFAAALAPWAQSDALRRARRLTRHFHGVPTLGVWPAGRKQPLVSIILATWNRAGELRSAVDSVLAQTWANWEVLIVDDGSWDDTRLLAELLASRDPRIRYIPRQHSGVSATRNAGLSQATGDYLTFLDSDNVWEPNFLQDMMIAMSEGDLEAAFSTLETIDGEKRLFREAPAELRSLENGNVVDLNILVVRRDVIERIGGFDETLARAVDYDLILRIAQRCTITHVPVLGAIYWNESHRSDRISVSQPLGWNTHVRVKNLLDWRELADRELTPGTDVVVIVSRKDPLVDEKLEKAVELAGDPDKTVHLAFIAPDPSSWARGQIAAAHAGVKTHLFGGPEPFSYVVTMMLDVATHEKLVMIEPAARFDTPTVRTLSERLDGRGARALMPVLRHRDGTVVTIGAAVPKPAAAPVDLLSRHPIEDARALGTEVPVPYLSGRTFAVRTRDLISARGLDPLLYNEYELPALSVALRQLHSDYQTVAATDLEMLHVELEEDFARIDPDGSLSRIRDVMSNEPATDVNALLSPLDFRVSHYRADRPHVERVSLVEPPAEGESGSGSDIAHARLSQRGRLHPVVIRDRRTITVGGKEVPRLRWALRIASPAGAVGETWGDTHFARSLAAALRRLGQEVVIDHHEITTRPSGYLDDVTLVIRGLDVVEPVTGGVSMLWVISHPDLVTRREASHFDKVFAASEKWARETSARWGLPIEPLLQCTDPQLFHPRGTPRTPHIVFVGNSRGVPRPAVITPVSAGIPIRVFGSEWEGILPPHVVEAPYVPNHELSELYESAAVVLNDHWNDMRRDGFISNRLFDVVAAGGRVISDDVEGINELFGDAVKTFRDSGELVDLLRCAPGDLFPGDIASSVAERVRQEHSFEARAQVLLDTARGALGLN